MAARKTRSKTGDGHAPRAGNGSQRAARDRVDDLSDEARSSNTALAREPERIVRRAGVCGGEAIVAGTRIPVWGLVRAHRAGIDDETILEMYPTVSREDLRAAFVYAGEHEDEMDRLIAENEGT